MKIVDIKGGLGNQMFQYIFYRYLTVNTDDHCYLDDSYFVNPGAPHNGKEIDKIFNINPLWLGDCFPTHVWESIVVELRRPDLIGSRFSVANISFLKECFSKYSGSQVFPEDNIYLLPPAFDSVALAKRYIGFSGHCYYSGYWITDVFYNEIKDIINKELAFPVFDVKNQKLADYMLDCSSIGIHIRRGGFVDNGWAMSAENYSHPVSVIKRKIKHPVFFIFSDEIEWCRVNLERMSLTVQDDIIFVTDNIGAQSYRDMQLMTYCQMLLPAPTSTFSYMADLLNCNPQRISFGNKKYYMPRTIPGYPTGAQTIHDDSFFNGTVFGSYFAT